MAFKVTIQPRNRIVGVKPTTETVKTAAAAWAIVQQLEASDEDCDVTDPAGRNITHQELKFLAAKEQN